MVGGRGGTYAKLLLDGRMSQHLWGHHDESGANHLSQVQGDVLVLYVYQLKTDPNGVENVGVEKVSFRKNGGLAAS